jgi:acetyl-CoA acetyltransferase
MFIPRASENHEGDTMRNDRSANTMGSAGGAALAMQRYMHLYGATSEKLAAVPIAIRAHASKNPRALMREPLTLEAHQSSRMVVDPLRLFDCCLITDAAAVVFVTTAERARDLRQKPVRILAMQGLRAGRDEFIFAPPNLGINQQPARSVTPRAVDLEVFARAGIRQADVDALYTYDAFSPLVLFVLERFGFCKSGQAADFVQDGRIGPGGTLPVNTSGGLLSEAHVGGWNSIAEMVRQLRGMAGASQLSNPRMLQWATCWGDSVILTAEQD